jgi:hypothetical protein
MRHLFHSRTNNLSGNIMSGLDDAHAALLRQPPRSQSQAPVAVCVSGRWSR